MTILADVPVLLIANFHATGMHFSLFTISSPKQKIPYSLHTPHVTKYLN